jgi:ATP-binding cassette subfamily C (CFTR/MRP) protein 1
MASNRSVTGYSTTSFGPTMVATFDFTPLFEDTFLSIMPSAGLILAVPPRLYFLQSQSRKVSHSALHSQKAVCFPKFLL